MVIFMINQRLIEARKRAGYRSAREAAAALGVNYQTYVSHENGNKGLSRSAERYAAAYRVSLDWLLRGHGSIADAGAPPSRVEAVSQRASQLSRTPIRQNRDLPILGQGAAALVGAVAIEEAIGYESRPPALAAVSDAYALYVAGDSMEPRYFSGEIVYVNPRRPCRSGDDVVVQVREQGVIVGYVKKLLRRTDEFVICTQYNNNASGKRIELRYPTRNVEAVHRILTAYELMQG